MVSFDPASISAGSYWASGARGGEGCGRAARAMKGQSRSCGIVGRWEGLLFRMLCTKDRASWLRWEGSGEYFRLVMFYRTRLGLAAKGLLPAII